MKTKVKRKQRSKKTTDYRDLLSDTYEDRRISRLKEFRGGLRACSTCGRTNGTLQRCKGCGDFFCSGHIGFRDKLCGACRKELDRYKGE